jgi:hypothetical protein
MRCPVMTPIPDLEFPIHEPHLESIATRRPTTLRRLRQMASVSLKGRPYEP